MNDKRRSKIKKEIEQIERCVRLLELVADEEQDALSNLPESLADSDLAAKMEEAEEHIRDAIANLECAVNSLDYAIH